MVDDFTQQVKEDTLKLYDLLITKININDNPYYVCSDVVEYFVKSFQDRSKFMEDVESVNRTRVDGVKATVRMLGGKGELRQRKMKGKK